MIKCGSRRCQHEYGGRKNLLHLGESADLCTHLKTFREHAILPEISDSGDTPEHDELLLGRDIVEEEHSKPGSLPNSKACNIFSNSLKNNVQIRN